VWRHAFKEGFLIPVTEIMSAKIPFLLGGAVIVEQVFNWARHGAHGVAGGAGSRFPGHYGDCPRCRAFVGTGNLVQRVIFTASSAALRGNRTQHSVRYAPDAGPIVGSSELIARAARGAPRSPLHGLWLLVVVGVVASYVLGAFGWLPDDPQAINVGLINAPPFTPGHLLGTDSSGPRSKGAVDSRHPGLLLHRLLASPFPSPAEDFRVSSRGTRAAGSIRHLIHVLSDIPR